MVKCAFCGKEEKSFKGVNLIKNDGSVNFFCSGKCRKNALKLGRDKRKLKWTEAFHLKREVVRKEIARIAEAEKHGKVSEEKAKK